MYVTSNYISENLIHTLIRTGISLEHKKCSQYSEKLLILEK